jgi:16S rRNA (cytosine967-C5)-methyltransferase
LSESRATFRSPAGRSVRSVAAGLVDLALSSQGPLDRALDAAQAPLPSRDRRLLQELVHGTLRWLLRLDDVVARAANRPLSRIELQLRSPLRLAAYQLLFLDRVPAYAAVSEAVEEARRRSPRGVRFVNAVLRRISRAPRLEEWPVDRADPIESLAIETSHPEFLVRRWIDAFGRDATEGILAANNRRRALQLLAGPGGAGRTRLAESLAAEGVETRPLELASDGLEVLDGDALATAAFANGEFYIQDQASQVAARVPPPRPGERIFDAAAAPGGKSLSLLACEPSVRIVAADVSRARVALLDDNRRRLGLDLALLVADARWPPLGAEFDRVVVDLPCSGTGILARHPELKWRLREAEIDRLAKRAAEILAGAATLVRSGGLLVAITCSIEQDENEFALRTLRSGGEYEPCGLDECLDPPLRSGVVGPDTWRLLPSTGNDGFTVQVLRKR